MEHPTTRDLTITHLHMGDCQNYGPVLGPYSNTGPNTGPNLRDPKRDHNFDNPPHGCLGLRVWGLGCKVLGLGFRVMERELEATL